MKPVGGGRLQEIIRIISARDHRRADNIGQGPSPQNIPSAIDLDIDAFGPLKCIHIHDDTVAAEIEVMMEISYSQTVITRQSLIPAVELLANQRCTIGDIKSIFEKN